MSCNYGGTELKTIEEQIQLVGSQAELERQLARLYSFFNKKFPGTELWPFLTEEEAKHECWLKQIIPKISEGSIILFVNDITIKAIEETIEDIISTCENAESKGISLIGAIKTAEKFEMHMLDKDFFKFLDSDAPVYSRILDKLYEDTKRHKELLIAAKLKAGLGQPI
jgi:hypothetical protein